MAKRPITAIAVTSVVLSTPSLAHAYWYNGVWIEDRPRYVDPYPYYRPPAPPAYASPRGRVWVEQRCNGYRWIPGHWQYY